MNAKARKIFRILAGLPKSIRFNLHYFPFKTALRCPVWLDAHVKVVRCEGEIVLPEKIRPGIIRIGFGEVGVFDRWRSRTLLELRGRIVFEGRAAIGHGSRISVFPQGTLTFGADFSATAEMTLVCTNEIVFDRRALVGWSAFIIDTDFHDTENPVTREKYRKEKPIFIGENVWICARAMILKGCRIPADVIVSAGAVACKDYSRVPPFCVLAGAPAAVRKENVRRI